jgi:hypothetical protein
MEYKACPSSYVVFGIICGIPLALSAAVLIRGADPSWWYAFVLSVLAQALCFLALSRYKLVITPEAVAYSNPFRFRRLIRRSEIVHADFAEETGRFESPITFVVRCRTGEQLRINAKVFSRDAVTALVDLSPDESM